jgi:hypothetical protein
LKHGVYILKGFKSHFEKILYPFKLKYLNQKVCHPTLKKHNIFLVNMEYIYIQKGFKSHIEKTIFFLGT